ncbi:MAG TPA: chloride channel protein [Gaiellaceae bacterium]|nr:chloride channel protein [Gaiellaceae bacterium]
MASTPPQLSGRAYLRLVLLGVLIGIPAALLASVFLAFVHDLEHWLWTDLPDAIGVSSPPWYLVIGLPVAGACVVVLARRFLPGDGGHSPLQGMGGGFVPLANGPGIALAAIGTLSFGAVLGPEAPLIALGAVTGVAVTSFVKLGEKEQAVVATAGSFSSISALFGGPIVGGMLMVEGGLEMGTLLIPVLLPGFVAAAVGYTIFVGLGNWGGLGAQGLTVPNLPEYSGTRELDLFLGAIVGVAAALVIVLVRRLATTVQADSRFHLGMPALLLGGALSVGLLAELADLLGANSQDVLFSGQASVPALAATDSTKILLVLLVAKAIAYAVSLGCGFRGGPVFPAIFLGIALATFPVVWFGTSPTLAVAIGAAAGMAAMTRLLIAPALFASLLVGSAGLDAVPAAVIAAAAAWLATAALDRRAPDAPAAAPATANA